MPKFEVLVLGTGDGFSQDRYSASFLLNAGGKFVAVECPGMFAKVLKDGASAARYKVGIKDVNDVIVSHIHGDHSNGLELFGYYKFFAEGKRPAVYSIKEVLGPLWGQKLKGSMGRMGELRFDRAKSMAFSDYFKGVELRPGIRSTVCGVGVEVRRARHTVPTISMKLSFAGRTLGYSADTAFDPGLIEFLDGCDVIFHEAGYGIHTDYSSLSSLPAHIKRRMRLIHFPDSLQMTDRSLRPLHEGEVIRLL